MVFVSFQQRQVVIFVKNSCPRTRSSQLHEAEVPLGEDSQVLLGEAEGVSLEAVKVPQGEAEGVTADDEVPLGEEVREVQLGEEY